jgi:glycosyltransferase involved in cell wall biosynthesis
MMKRIAVFTPGGIGAGNFLQGHPPFISVVTKLSTLGEIHVYSISPVNKNFIPSQFKVYSISGRIKGSMLRAVLISIRFGINHLRGRYSLIHAFWVYPAGTLAVLFSKILSIPSIVTVQGGEAAAVPEIGYGNMLKPFLKKVTLFTCEKATTLVVISEFLLHQLKKHGLERNDVVIIPIGPDTKQFKYFKKHKGSTIRIIHVANLTEVKDQYTLLNVFSRIRKEYLAELVIIGADHMGGKIQAFSRQLGVADKVRFLGPVAHEELPQYYASADIMILTSLHEGQSVVAVEAMASGVPVFGTRVGILYDWPDATSSVPVGDADGLVNSIMQCWNHYDRLELIRTKALEKVAHYNLDWTIRKFFGLYEKLLK